MKRILLTALLLLGPALHQTQAQSWKNILGNLFGGSKKEEKVPEKTPAEPRCPTAQELTGAWTYTEATLAYTGSDMLASLAVAGLQGQIGSYFAKAGLVPGRDGLTFGPKSALTLRIGEREASGTYTYNQTDGTIVITLTVDGKSASFCGSGSLAGDVLTLLFDANEALAVAKKVAPSAFENGNVQTVASIVEKYPGLMIGCKMKR